MRNSNIPSAAPTGPQHPSAAARGQAAAPGSQGCSAPGEGIRTRGFGGSVPGGARAHRGPSRGEGRSHAQSRAALGSPRSRSGSGHRRVPPPAAPTRARGSARDHCRWATCSLPGRLRECTCAVARPSTATGLPTGKPTRARGSHSLPIAWVSPPSSACMGKVWGGGGGVPLL